MHVLGDMTASTSVWTAATHTAASVVLAMSWTWTRRHVHVRIFIFYWYQEDFLWAVAAQFLGVWRVRCYKLWMDAYICCCLRMFAFLKSRYLDLILMISWWYLGRFGCMCLGTWMRSYLYQQLGFLLLQVSRGICVECKPEPMNMDLLNRSIF